jgi:choline dehydrogenase-like flavoprotein
LEYAARLNLNIVTNTRVSRILASSTAKDGTPEFRTVEFASSHGGETRTLTATKEVILAAGAIGTPSLLLHSGIGASSDLASVGIKPLVDLPSVGKNLTDHPMILNEWLVNSTDTRDHILRDSTRLIELFASYLAGGGEFLVDTPLSQLGFARMTEDHPIYAAEHDPSAGSLSPHYEFLLMASVSYRKC